MSFFVRQYGAREYGLTLAVAAIAGLVIAVLINSASGGAGQPALLKTTHEEVAKTSPVPVAPKVHARKAQPASRRSSRRHHRRHRARAAPVVRAAPAVLPTGESNASTPSTSTTPTTSAPVPVVRRPAPAPKPAPSRKGGGGIQFDDSG